MTADNSLASAESVMINRLLSNIPSGYTLANISQPNAPFNKDQEKWLRVSCVGGDVDQIDASGAVEINFGILTVDVFVPKGSGSQGALTTAKTIKDLYQGYGLNDVYVTRCTTDVIGETGVWWCVAVKVFFDYQIQFI